METSIKNLNQLAKRDYEWVEKMGWHNKTTLESLALTGAEIGESAAECLGSGPTDHFGEELADVFLMIADLAYMHKIDLEELVQNTEITWQTKTLKEDFAELFVDFSKWVNTARQEVLGTDFAVAMGRVLGRIFDIALREGVNLEREILRKMDINEDRGTRGRLM